MKNKFRIALAAALFASASPVLAQTADVVFVNGKVYTADSSDSVVEAFAISGDHFVKAGSDADVRKLAGPNTKVVDLNGRFVMPGLTDDHFHGVGGGDGVALAKVRSMAELLAALKDGVAKAAPGAMVISNGDWHEAQLNERRKPTVEDLDTVSATVPIIVVRGGHSLFLNSAALKKFNIDKNTPVPDGGSIERTADGRLTGELVDTAKGLVKMPAQPPLTEADLVRTQREMNAYGATAVRIPGAFFGGTIQNMVDMARGLQARDALTLRYTVLRPGPGMGGGTLEDLKTGPQQGEGDEWVRFDGIKLMVDGGFEGAHFSHAYAEPFGRGGTFNGIVVTPPEKTNADILALQKMGWHIAVHAAGDAGIDQALDAFEQADKVSPLNGQRWALEHAFIIREDQLARLKRLGIALSLQDHLYLAAPSMEKFWGRDRAERVSPAETYMNAGLLVAGGTDAPVIPPSPLWAMYHFASRDTINAGVFGANEAVMPRAKVLRMFTINYAKLIGAEKVRGSIEAGKLADFAVFSNDLLDGPVIGIRDAKALVTYIGGREVYAAKDGK